MAQDRNPSPNTIYLTAGDSDTITVSLSENSGPLLLKQGDTLYFSVKRRVRDTHYAFQKVVTEFEADGSAVIEIEPQDTHSLPPSNYKYDVQITFADGTVATIVKPSDFVVEAGVTHD